MNIALKQQLDSLIDVSRRGNLEERHLILTYLEGWYSSFAEHGDEDSIADFVEAFRRAVRSVEMRK